MAELVSDDVDEIVILASSAIIFSICALLFNTKRSRETGVILSGFEVTCSLAINMGLATVSCETWEVHIEEKLKKIHPFGRLNF